MWSRSRAKANSSCWTNVDGVMKSLLVNFSKLIV